MSKRKQKKSPVSAEEKKETRADTRKGNRILPIVGALVLFALLGAGLIYYFFGGSEKKTVSPNLGTVTGCQKIPAFVGEVGFSTNAVFTTADRKIRGLLLVEGERKYQHPSWKSAGSLAPITRDGKGNVFSAPAPWINILENKPEEQNRVYRIDGKTQEMKQFIELPKALSPTSENPYGVLGLSFDCETSSIYASSVSGSTRKNEVGRIFRIDSEEAKIGSQLETVDAMGLSVFNSANGKRLYYGLTRISEIWSVALNEKGDFVGKPRKEVSLEGLGARGDDKARRINFVFNRQNKEAEMQVFGIEFNFNLIAPTEKQETLYRFRYDILKDSFEFLKEPPQVVLP